MSSAKRLAREILDTRRLALGHATSPQLTSSAIDGGGIDFRDADGNPIAGIGVGDDGGFIIDYTGGPKPPKPSPPTVTADAGIFRIEWDGSFVNEGDAGVLATSDTDRVEIHASMDENFVPDRVESFGGAFATLDGGSFALGPLPEAGTYYFRLVARSKSAQFSEPSDRVEQELAITSIDLEVIDAWLTGEAAQNTADGKNSIWRGPDEPEADPDRPFKDGDIWFEMTDDGKSIPNIWDEDSGAWVANDDYRQSEIEKVQQELREDLDAIVVDGSGTTNYYQGTPPDASSSPPPKEGDLWFDSSDSNKPYIYQDGEWITVRDSFSKAGAAERFASVRDKHSLDNWWSNVPGFALDSSVKPTVPSGASGDATIKIALQGSFDPAGNWVLDETGVSPNGLPIGIESQIYVKSSGGAPTGNFVFGLQVPGGNPASAPVPLDVVSGGGPITGATHQLSVSATAKSYAETYGTIAERMWSSIEITLPAAAAGDFIAFETLSASYLVPSTGIADKAITTEKIATGAITAESGIIGSINAGTITVGEMNGARIKAGTINASLALIESSIGSTLIKDGAILTDHIKVGAITAESGIIGSIDANVITVGKIMGNQLDADAINGKTITGATVRTASSGARVELTQNGLKQYNSLGAAIVDMTAGSFALEGGTITGSTIKTATSGSRVEITTQGLRQFNSSDEPIVTMADGGVEIVGGLQTTSGDYFARVGMVNTTTPGFWFNRPAGKYPAGMFLTGTQSAPGLTLQGGSSVGDGGSMPGSTLKLYSPGATSVLELIGTGSTGKGAGIRVNKDTYSSTVVGGLDGLTNQHPATMTFSHDSTGQRVLSAAIFNRKYGAGNPVVRVTSTGALGADSSARRFKFDEQELGVDEYANRLMSVPYKSWISREEQRLYEEYIEFRETFPMSPVPEQLGEAPQEPPLRDVGLVAEDLVDAGLEEFVQRDSFGQTQGVSYDRIAAALIPIVRSQRDRIEVLEARIAALEAA